MAIVDDNVQMLEGFMEAYPTSVFPEVTEEERDWLMKERRGLLDRISAGMGRHIGKCLEPVYKELVSLRQETRTQKRELQEYLDELIRWKEAVRILEERLEK